MIWKVRLTRPEASGATVLVSPEMKDRKNFTKRPCKGKFIVSMGILDQGYKGSGNMVEHPEISLQVTIEKRKKKIRHSRGGISKSM